MAYMVGGRVVRLGSFPGREGEGLGLFLEDGNAPRVARIVYLPGVDPAEQEGLEREVARAADALHHPHVEPPLGVADVDGRLAVAVEYTDGETLAEILAVGGRLSPPVAARIVRDACVAVQFAHDEGQDGAPILHGWLRPSNLLVSRSGITRVSGFGVGLARSAGDLMPWQSPEQVLGGPRAASRGSDVHGLGLVLHACLAGENPFEHDPDPDVAILSRTPPLLDPLGVPSALSAVVRRALAVKGPDRYASPRALARAIEEAVPDLATPSTVAAWSESLFPAGMGMRVLRQRAVDAAVVAAARETRRKPVSDDSAPVPLPEPRAAVQATPAPEVAKAPARPTPARAAPAPAAPRSPTLLPPPPLGFRPAPAPVQARTTARLHVAPPPEVDDDPVGEFSLAAPPFPHPVRPRNPVDSIEIDVVLSDPPPPLRLPVPPRPAAGSVQAIGRDDVRVGGRG